MYFLHGCILLPNFDVFYDLQYIIYYGDFKHCSALEPHSTIFMTEEGGGGGPNEVHILYPKISLS